MLPKYTTHRFFFDHIKPHSRVLDIGCGSGAIGKGLNKEKGCFVVGIDTADQPEKPEGYAHFMNLDVTNVEFEINRFDYIILGDVLEHLNDPKAVLMKVKRWLVPDGKILISVPNIANWKIRLDLLFGNFEYTNNGILDRTHKKFFTKKTIINLIESTGLKIEQIDVTSDLKPAWFWREVGLKVPAFAHQFIIVLRIRDGNL